LEAGGSTSRRKRKGHNSTGAERRCSIRSNVRVCLELAEFRRPLIVAQGRPVSDHLHTLVSGILDNLTSRLTAQQPHWASLAAFVGDALRNSLKRVRHEERWDLTGQPPPKELDQLDALLVDLHAVLAELAWGGMPPAAVMAAARAGDYRRALTRAGDRAGADAAARLGGFVDSFERAAATSGLRVQV
jgi:hypothetical protein